tara:strand:+ start:1513 stop:1770 length:258 start_codon:yes stop_codon:yes gene_type:complete
MSKFTYKEEQECLWQMLDDIWPKHEPEDKDRTLQAELADVERKAIALALDQFDYNQTKAARELGMGRTLLIHKIKKYQLTNTVDI